jgi:DNA-directed RNA polymerase subunit beta'
VSPARAWSSATWARSSTRWIRAPSRLHSRIKARLHTVDETGAQVVKVVETTPGRMLLSEILPQNKDVPFSLINRVLTKKDIQNVIDVVYRHCGQKETVIFADRLMSLGFGHACRAGISFGKDDLVIPASKEKLVAQTQKEVKEYEQQYQDGLITSGEKYNKVVDAWSRCSEKVADEMMKGISTPKKGDPINSVFMMAHSGARGSAAQMKQLAGMRGLMAKPSGEIIETPIISNFKEGLSVLEYFNSTHGARKGLADTALKTANSGYLTRRLVDVAQDCIITEVDCGTKDGLTMRAVVDGSDVIEPLGERILGRSALEDIVDPLSGTVLVKASALIGEEDIDADRARRYRGGEDPLGADLRYPLGHLRHVLRPRSRARYAGQHRRGGGRHRRAVDRRAGHAAHHAHLPHRRRRAAWRGAVERRGLA